VKEKKNEFDFKPGIETFWNAREKGIENTTGMYFRKKVVC